ncbi:MAG: copper-binding protein [Betaproteobacteria bacterium]|jgi:Cu/Ag efflux protein CusF|nr:copper-binding protein [Betaproteobacteria bacterium]
MKPALLLMMLTALGAAAPAVAQKPADEHAAHHPSQATAAGELADGEIRRVDRDAKKITIRHGPIPSLKMPPMTMVFQTADPALLDRVKPGDKVKFSAIHDRGAYIVTRIETAP